MGSYTAKLKQSMRISSATTSPSSPAMLTPRSHVLSHRYTRCGGIRLRVDGANLTLRWGSSDAILFAIPMALRLIHVYL